MKAQLQLKETTGEGLFICVFVDSESAWVHSKPVWRKSDIMDGCF